MRLTNFNSRLIFVLSLIILSAVSRLIVHTANFTPVAAIALFGGAYLSNRFLAFFIPIAALLISDIFLGYYGAGMVPVYGAYLLIILTGISISKRITPTRVIGASLLGSVLFFLITNFAFFYSTALYPHNWTGIMMSYAAALPFFRATLVSDLCFNVLLFGGFYLAQLKFPELSKIKK